MLRSIEELYGYKISGIDGEVGKVSHFLFDDLVWSVRYLVADTGSWLREKLVLISPYALKQPDWNNQRFPVNLSREQIEQSPGMDEHKPVSRQHEIRLSEHFNWPAYWAGAGMVNVGGPIFPSGYTAETEEAVEVLEDNESQLRSTSEVAGYRIRATDGEIGHVHDFIVDDADWSIRYIVVDTKKWWSGKKVLLAPAWIDHIDWAGAQVHVDVKKETIADAPEFDASTPINRKYEERLYDFHGRPAYWT